MQSSIRLQTMYVKRDLKQTVNYQVSAFENLDKIKNYYLKDNFLFQIRTLKIEQVIAYKKKLCVKNHFR